MLSNEETVDNEKLFAIQLADNDKKVRDKCLTKVRNYIQSRANTHDGRRLGFVVQINPFFNIKIYK
jgi:hypothetical protein